MADNISKDKILTIYNRYLKIIEMMGKSIPSWLRSVNFEEGCFEGSVCAAVCAESNTIIYTEDATESSIVHELEHLRSRHKQGYVCLDEKERPNIFYSIGFCTNSGFGVFVEEGANEYMARKIYMIMLENFETGGKKKAIKDYVENKSYSFEIFTLQSICAMLDIDFMKFIQNKYSGDETGQELLNEKIDDLAGSVDCWERMQEVLDLFELDKQKINGRLFCEQEDMCKLDIMYKFYYLAYKCLFDAVKHKKITPFEFDKRLRNFESCAKKSCKYMIGLSDKISYAKKDICDYYFQTISKNCLFGVYSGFDGGDEPLKFKILKKFRKINGEKTGEENPDSFSFKDEIEYGL